jgi:hypothetical protein
MLDYDNNEHEHLPVNNYSSHNVRRKKIYRQMALYINSGPQVAKEFGLNYRSVLWMAASECFPSPIFMGFKEKN